MVMGPMRQAVAGTVAPRYGARLRSQTARRGRPRTCPLHSKLRSSERSRFGISHIEAAHETGKERESMKTRRVEPFRRLRGKRRAQSAESLVIILAYP